MDKTDLAYAAGIIDGEGCIYIDHWKDLRRPGTINYLLRIQVAMVDKEVPYWLEGKFGGTTWLVEKSKYDGSNRKNQLVWKISNKQAIDFLSLIKPFIQVKYRQIEIAEEFDKTVLRDKSKGRDYTTKERLYNAMHNANQRKHLDLIGGG